VPRLVAIRPIADRLHQHPLGTVPGGGIEPLSLHLAANGLGASLLKAPAVVDVVDELAAREHLPRLDGIAVFVLLSRIGQAVEERGRGGHTIPADDHRGLSRCGVRSYTLELVA